MVIIRGRLVLAVCRKTTELKLSASDDIGVITLISTDVERTLIVIRDIHEYWANCMQVGVACFLLQSDLSTAFVAPVIVIMLSTFTAACMGKLAGPRQHP